MKNRIPPDPDNSIVAKVLEHKDDLAGKSELSSTQMELILLRTKLENRTWMLRAAMTYAVGITTALIVAALNHFGIIF